MILSSKDSRNKKLGKKVRTTYRQVGPTCPKTCRHLESGSCYASFGRVAIHSNRSGEPSRSDGQAVLDWIRDMPQGRRVRHHVSGDILNNGVVDTDYVESIYAAHMERPDILGWGYTHAWRDISPLDLNHDSLTFNASADSLEEADEALAMGWPTVVTVAEDSDRMVTPGGNTVVICPEQTSGVSCSDCGLCMKSGRSTIVGFRLHGQGKNKFSA